MPLRFFTLVPIRPHLFDSFISNCSPRIFDSFISNYSPHLFAPELSPSSAYTSTPDPYMQIYFLYTSSLIPNRPHYAPAPLIFACNIAHSPYLPRHFHPPVFASCSREPTQLKDMDDDWSVVTAPAAGGGASGKGKAVKRSKGKKKTN